MKSKLTPLVLGACALLMLLPLRVAAESIEVTPSSWDYGPVGVDTSAAKDFELMSGGSDAAPRIRG